MKEKGSCGFSVLALVALSSFSAFANSAFHWPERFPLIVSADCLDSKLINPKLVMVDIPRLTAGNYNIRAEIIMK